MKGLEPQFGKAPEKVEVTEMKPEKAKKDLADLTSWEHHGTRG